MENTLNVQEIKGQCNGCQDDDKGDVDLASGNGEKVDKDGPENEVLWNLCGRKERKEEGERGEKSGVRFETTDDTRGTLCFDLQCPWEAQKGMTAKRQSTLAPHHSQTCTHQAELNVGPVIPSLPWTSKMGSTTKAAFDLSAWSKRQNCSQTYQGSTRKIRCYWFHGVNVN